MDPELNPYAAANPETLTGAQAPQYSSRLSFRSRAFIGGFCIFLSSFGLLVFFLVAHRGFQSLGDDLLNVMPVTLVVGFGVLVGLLAGTVLHSVFSRLRVPVRIQTTLVIGAVLLALIISLRCRGLVFPGPWPISLGRVYWFHGFPISGYAMACCILACVWTAIASIRHNAPENVG
ncbi:MAG: hypothetical protein AAF802_26810 [Planctomycetota bacterium]